MHNTIATYVQCIQGPCSILLADVNEQELAGPAVVPPWTRSRFLASICHGHGTTLQQQAEAVLQKLSQTAKTHTLNTSSLCTEDLYQLMS